MALIVEDGTGKTDAESYLSVADCDTYHENHGDSSTWSGATTANKEDALRRATQYIDINYNGQWRGIKGSRTNALDWPRLYVNDDDQYYWPSNEIPQRLKDATAEMALVAIGTSDLMATQTTPGTISRYKVKVGPIEEDTSYLGGRSQSTYYPKIDALLKQFIIPGGKIRRA